MNKSVFTKYMVAFALIIFISFLLLAFIISTFINRYATETIHEDVMDTSIAAGNVLEFNYQRNESTGFAEYIMTHQDIVSRVLGGFKNEGNINRHLILITDSEGNILSGMHIDKDDLPMTEVKTVSIDIMSQLSEDGVYEANGTLDGLLVQRFIIYARTIRNTSGDTVGAIFSCSSTALEGALIKVMNRTVVMASLWVMLAAVIAVYFISDRITSPLRSMTAATKEFARGKMDTRVQIHGNDEIAELGNAFNNMAESLQENEKMRNSFLANVSHDLRTPMTTIAGFVDGMISGAIPPDKQPEYLEIVSSEVHRLSRLVGQILDVSRLESGERKFTYSRFDICEMARLILISFEQKIDEKKLEVEFCPEADNMYAYGDSDATHQVLYNLCDNALKFSVEGGVLRIGIKVAVPGTLEVSVYNEGQGIPEEDLPYVFERFYKSDKSRGLDKTGVGLGLYIAKTILEAQKQHIEVSSVAGEYCEFRFTLKEDGTENN